MQQKEIFRRVRYAVAWALLFLFIVCLLGKYAKQQRQQQQQQRQQRQQPASWHCEWKLGKQSTFPTFVVDKHLRDMRAGNRVCNICLPGTGLPCLPCLPPPPPTSLTQPLRLPHSHLRELQHIVAIAQVDSRP